MYSAELILVSRSATPNLKDIIPTETNEVRALVLLLHPTTPVPIRDVQFASNLLLLQQCSKTHKVRFFTTASKASM